MEFKSEQNLSKPSTPIAIITLDIGNIIETVHIKENDNIEQIAKDITKKFNLNNDAIQFLIENINHQIKINQFQNLNKTASIQSLKMIQEQENKDRSLAEIQYESWQKMIKKKFDCSNSKEERKSPSYSANKITERIRNKKMDSENISNNRNKVNIDHKKQNDSENINEISNNSNQELSKNISKKNEVLEHEIKINQVESKNLHNQTKNQLLDQNKSKDKSRSISFNKKAFNISEQLYNDGKRKLRHQKNAEKIKEEIEIQNCTFRPRINEKSKRIMSSEKKQQHLNSKKNFNPKKTFISSKNINIHDKLYTEGLIDELNKEKWRRERFKKDCPFQPNVYKYLEEENRRNPDVNLQKLIERLLNSKKISDLDLQNLKMKENNGRDKVSGQRLFHPVIKKDKYYQSAKEKENLQYEEFSKKFRYFILT